jgi:hypothetical protein
VPLRGVAFLGGQKLRKKKKNRNKKETLENLGALARFSIPRGQWER